MAGEEGFEPSHAGIKIQCLNQLGDSPTQLCCCGNTVAHDARALPQRNLYCAGVKNGAVRPADAVALLWLSRLSSAPVPASVPRLLVIRVQNCRTRKRLIPSSLHHRIVAATLLRLRQPENARQPLLP